MQVKVFVPLLFLAASLSFANPALSASPQQSRSTRAGTASVGVDEAPQAPRPTRISQSLSEARSTARPWSGIATALSRFRLMSFSRMAGLSWGLLLAVSAHLPYTFAYGRSHVIEESPGRV